MTAVVYRKHLLWRLGLTPGAVWLLHDSPHPWFLRSPRKVHTIQCLLPLYAAMQRLWGSSCLGFGHSQSAACVLMYGSCFTIRALPVQGTTIKAHTNTHTETHRI